MFEKYNINDLYLAIVNVIYANKCKKDFSVIGETTIEAGYGYTTVLYQNKSDKLIDLENMSVEITNTRCPNTTSYVVEYMEPLGNYYISEKKKEMFSRREAIKESKKYTSDMHQKYYANKEHQKLIRTL